jgi:hypothetical protein
MRAPRTRKQSPFLHPPARGIIPLSPPIEACRRRSGEHPCEKPAAYGFLQMSKNTHPRIDPPVLLHTLNLTRWREESPHFEEGYLAQSFSPLKRGQEALDHFNLSLCTGTVAVCSQNYGAQISILTRRRFPPCQGGLGGILLDP